TSTRPSRKDALSIRRCGGSARCPTDAAMDFARAFGQQNATLREQLASMSPHLLEQAVAREIPNWKEINRDPAWLQWLAGRHPYSGWTRQQLLDDAVRTG